MNSRFYGFYSLQHFLRQNINCTAINYEAHTMDFIIQGWCTFKAMDIGVDRCTGIELKLIGNRDYI